MPQTRKLKRLLINASIGIAIILSSAIISLAMLEEWSIGHAAYTVLMMFGAGEVSYFHPEEAKPASRFLAVLVVYAGVLGVAMLVGAVVDILFRMRLPDLFEKRASKMKDHIILCGLGHVGYRVLIELEKFGQEVVVIEQSEGGPFEHHVHDNDIPLIHGDVRNDKILLEAGIKTAAAIICCTDDDLTNLEVALDAREMCADIRVVCRLFDQRLADKIAKGFNIQIAFSSSSLAAPAFAAAAVDPSVKSSFYVQDHLYVCSEFVVPQGSELVGRSVRALRDDQINLVMFHRSGEAPNWAPNGDDLVPPDSIVHVVGPFDQVLKLRAECTGCK